jgi:hypothetical protein
MTWIRTGELQALNVGTTARPQFVILPDHAQAFDRSRLVVPRTKVAKRRKTTAEVDYYPDS